VHTLHFEKWNTKLHLQNAMQLKILTSRDLVASHLIGFRARSIGAIIGAQTNRQNNQYSDQYGHRDVTPPFLSRASILIVSEKNRSITDHCKK
jgi:hypothetical protein